MNKSRFVRQASLALLYVLVLLTIVPIFGTAYAQVDIQADIQAEPLTETEQWAVLNGAFQTGVAGGATSLAEATALRQEVLLVERHADADLQGADASSSGDAYIYDYATNTLNVVTVELATGQATNIRSSKGIQIALTPNEIDRAALIAVGNTEILELAKAAYQEQTGSPFTELKQIETLAAIFTAVDSPNIVNMQSAECGIHRCALLTFTTADGSPMGIQPIVDLSTQLVVQNITDPDAIVSPAGDLGFSDTGMIIDENSTPELPGATNNPLAANEPGNLGITSPGMIIDESAVSGTAVSGTTVSGTTVSGTAVSGTAVSGTAVTQDSPAPSKQAGQNVADTGVILSESDLSNNASTSPSHQNDIATGNTTDPNNLGFVDTGTITAESTNADNAENQQNTTLGAAKANIFIPFMARRLFKNKARGMEVTFQEDLFISWWCSIVDGSPLATEVSGICNR